MSVLAKRFQDALRDVNPYHFEVEGCGFCCCIRRNEVVLVGDPCRGQDRRRLRHLIPAQSRMREFLFEGMSVEIALDHIVSVLF